MAATAEAHAHAPEPLEDLTLRAVDTYSKQRGLDARAGRVLLRAIQDFTVTFIAAWNTMREGGTTAEKLRGDLAETHFQLAEMREWAEILAACRAGMSPHQRNHFTPVLRFRILEHMSKHMLTIEQTARRFVLSGQTIRNWLAELKDDPEATTIGKPLLDAVPPIRRFGDGVRRLMQQMSDVGLGGKKKIAETLMRLGWKVDPRTVGRVVKEARISTAPEPSPPPGMGSPRPTTVRGDYPNHLVLIDITRIPMLFPFLWLHLAVVLDAFSRLPLAVTVRFLEPSARDMVALLERAIRAHGRPRHLVVDQGPQFMSCEFKTFVGQHGILIRYGAVGEPHSLGLIDRFFKTLKNSLGVGRFRPWAFRGLADFTRRLDIALIHYSYVRPHASLAGMTPIERYYGIRGHLPQPVPPPRGRRGDAPVDSPFEIAFLDPESEMFPFVVPRAA